MDRVQIGMIALAVMLLVFWFTTLPESPTPEPGAPIAEPRERPTEAPPISPLVERGAPPIPGGADDESRQEPVMRATLENDAMRLVVSSLGGRLESVQLKAYPARLGAVEEPVELVTFPTRGIP